MRFPYGPGTESQLPGMQALVRLQEIEALWWDGAGRADQTAFTTACSQVAKSPLHKVTFFWEAEDRERWMSSYERKGNGGAWEIIFDGFEDVNYWWAIKRTFPQLVCCGHSDGKF